MTEELQGQLSIMLSQLSDTLGVAIPKLWEWALLQVQVETITSILVILFSIVAMISCISYWKFFIRLYRGKELDGDTESLYFVGGGILTIITIIMFILGSRALFKLIGYMVNPEYSAFRLIVEELAKLN